MSISAYNETNDAFLDELIMLMGVIYLLVRCKKKIKYFKSCIRYNESLIRMDSLSIASHNATIVRIGSLLSAGS